MSRFARRVEPGRRDESGHEPVACGLAVADHFFHKAKLLVPKVLRRAATRNVRGPLGARLGSASHELKKLLLHGFPRGQTLFGDGRTEAEAVELNVRLVGHVQTLP